MVLTKKKRKKKREMLELKYNNMTFWSCTFITTWHFDQFLKIFHIHKPKNNWNHNGLVNIVSIINIYQQEIITFAIRFMSVWEVQSLISTHKAYKERERFKKKCRSLENTAMTFPATALFFVFRSVTTLPGYTPFTSSPKVPQTFEIEEKERLAK